jgi:hypothetical protein
MAETFTDEGLDWILGIVPKGNGNAAPAQTLYIGFFTSQTASTVPATSATGGASPSGWTEATGTGYARQSIAAGSWGAQAAGTGGRNTAAGQVTFPSVGSGAWGTINGFFIATNSASGAGDKTIFFANFSDTTAIVTAQNDVIKITPTWQLNN